MQEAEVMRSHVCEFGLHTSLGDLRKWYSVAVNGPHPFLMLESIQMHANPFLNCVSVRFQGSWANPERWENEGKDCVPTS